MWSSRAERGGQQRRRATPLLSPLIYSLHIQFVMPGYTLQEKAETGDYFFLYLFLMFLHFDCVWLYVCSYGRDLCVHVCLVVVCVCVFLSVEEKWGRQLAEIEGNDCDLRTKSRAKCFLSPLFSLFSTFCPGSLIFPLLLCLCLFLCTEHTQKKKQSINLFFSPSLLLLAVHIVGLVVLT